MTRIFPAYILALFLPTAANTLLAQSPETGWLRTAAGTYSYSDANNWVGGSPNGIWDSTLTLAGNQTITLSGDTTLDGLSFKYLGNFTTTLRATGANATLTLGGDIEVLRETSLQVMTLGATAANQQLSVNLGGGTRTFTVWGNGNGATSGNTLRFLNSVTNGSVIASGGGTGGGTVQFAATSNTLGALTVQGAEVYFNGANYSGVNATNTISGPLRVEGGKSYVTALSHSTSHMAVNAGSFERAAGSIVVFRGNNLGVNDASLKTADSSNIMFSTAPTLTGGGGGANQSTISILAGAVGSTTATGSGLGGLLTYDAGKGVRLLNDNEYVSSITSGQTQLDNVRFQNSSGAQINVALDAGVTTVNSLSFFVTGDTGNQGVNITGATGSVLKINSGVILGYQNVTVPQDGSPASTDAMRIQVPTLDFNGQEATIFAGTRLNNGGTRVSNGGLYITGAITNANGLTFNSGYNSSGYIVLDGATANSYSGPAIINGAIVRLGKSITNSTFIGDVILNGGSIYDGGNQIANESNVYINDGTLYLNGSNNSGSAQSETINNLTITGGGVNSGSGNGNTFNVNGNLTMQGGRITMPMNSKFNVGGTSNFSGGGLTIGRSDNGTYKSKTTFSGPLNITNTARFAYAPITITPGNAAGVNGGQLELSGDVNFTGNSTNTNTVTIAAATGTGFQGVVALNGTRTFNIGDGAAATDLTVEAPMINGTSTGGLAKAGAGTLALNGDNTYTGPTTVSEGTLRVNGAFSNSSSVSISGSGVFHYTNGAAGLGSNVSVNGGEFKYNSSQAYSGALTFNSGTISGSGNLSSVELTIGAGRTLSPGNSPGTLNTGAETWADGGSYLWEINALATSTVPGSEGTDPGWDFLNVTGALTISAAAGQFTLNVDSLGVLDNWDGDETYQWRIATASGGITGFDAGAFTINASAFLDQNSMSGMFYLSNVGNNIFLNYTPVPEPSAGVLFAIAAVGLVVRRKR